MRRFSVLKFFLPPFYFSLVETLKKRSVQNKHPPLHLPPGEKKNVPNQDPPRRPHRGLHAGRRLPLRVLERSARDRGEGAPGGLPLREALVSPRGRRRRPDRDGGCGRRSGGSGDGNGDGDDDGCGSRERGQRQQQQQPFRQSEAEPRDRAREPRRRRDESERRRGRRGGISCCSSSCRCCCGGSASSGDGGSSLRRGSSGAGGGGRPGIALCGSDGGHRCRL